MTTMTQGSGLTLELLAGDIKARIERGDRDARNSEGHYRAAGIHLIEAKTRVADELPETTWLMWSALNFPQVGERRIEQLISIGRGLSTQDAINEAERNRYADMTSRIDEVLRRTEAAIQSESDTAQTCAVSPRTPRRDRDFAARRERRAEARSIRESAGAPPMPPRRTREHNSLLKEYRAIGDRLGIELLRAAINVIRRMETNEA